jgi:heptosyltransferase I
MPSPRDILVIRLTSLGDVLLATPAVQAIKRGLPQCRITWLVEGSVAGLLAHQNFVDQVIEFPRGAFRNALRRGGFFSVGSIFSSFCRIARSEEYDLVVDFHGIMKSAILARIVRAPKHIGFDRTFAKEGSWMAYDEKITGGDKRMHKVDRNMLLASHLGLDPSPDVCLQTSAESDAYIDEWFRTKTSNYRPSDDCQAIASNHRPRGDYISNCRTAIAVNPFCSKGSEFKRWDFAGYAGVIEKMDREMGATAVILWGPGEEEEARKLQGMTGGRAVLAPPTTVSQLLSLVKKTVLYVGGDTGTMHLAALAGVPVVAVFGPTDHLINGPYGTGHTIVRNEQPCSPCRDKSCRRRTCIRSISVDQVYGAVQKTWEGRIS